MASKRPVEDSEEEDEEDEEDMASAVSEGERRRD